MSVKEPDEQVLELMEDFLKLPAERFKDAEKVWCELSEFIPELETATKEEPPLSKKLGELTNALKHSASKLTRSVSASKGSLADDWKSFAERDLESMKDEVMALQEFILEERDRLKKGLRRATLWKNGCIDPERLFKELHEMGAISERTWVLIMTHPASLREVKDREASERLRRIAKLHLELQEVRSGG